MNCEFVTHRLAMDMKFRTHNHTWIWIHRFYVDMDGYFHVSVTCLNVAVIK